MRRLACALLALWLVLCVTSVVRQAAYGDIIEVVLTPALGVLAGVGTLLALRRPANSVGWILLVLAVLVTASVAAEGVYRGYEGESDPPLAIRLLHWFDQWVIFLWFGLVGVLLPLLFPDGRLPGPRWRPLLWAGTVVVGLASAGTAVGARRFDWGESGSIANPLAVGGSAGDALRLFASLGGIGFAAVLLCVIASVVVRTRRSSGVERQQLKWFAYAIGLLLAGLAAAAVSEAIGWEPLGNVGWFLFLGSLIFAMPIAIAIAILRHRLYDIDLVIRRTLVYGALTLTLAAAYLCCVLLAQLVIGARSDFAIAGSTLAMAALFRPVRARIQALVDRRFYRRRYDAGQTLEAFGARLRDELDLDALGDDLRAVVHDTVQPVHVSLWLRAER